VYTRTRLLLCAALPTLLLLPLTSLAAPGVTPSEGGGSASCIFGANGSVVFAPPGANCGEVAVATAAPTAEEFSAPVLSDSGAWLPADPGVEKLFVHIVERRETTGDSPETRRLLRGTRHEVFAPAHKREGAGAVEMRVTKRLSGPGRPDQLVTELHTVKPSANAYRVQSSILEWKGGRKSVAYSEPVKLLPDTIEKGATWNAGTGTFDEVTIQRTGEIVGLQDVNTPAGPVPGCLVVRYRTRLSGRGLVQGVPQDVADSEIVRTVWFARGVGMVLAKEEMHETVEVFGQPTEIHVRAQSGLKGVKRVTTTPASTPTR
jgi:hypothetical protein